MFATADTWRFAGGLVVRDVRISPSPLPVGQPFEVALTVEDEGDDDPTLAGSWSCKAEGEGIENDDDGQFTVTIAVDELGGSARWCCSVAFSSAAT